MEFQYIMVNYLFSDKLFGDKIEITLFDTESSMAEIVTTDAYKEALRLQQIFNVYDETSEINKLNQNKELTCSHELLELIKKSLKYCKLTNGRYDISKGKQYLSRKSNEKEIIPKCSYKDIAITKNKISLTHPDVLIDLGSVAKGYIVDKVTEYLIEQGVVSGIVNGRGDIRVFGENKHLIEIQHPRIKEAIIDSVQIKNEGIATSGDYNQYKSNFDSSHIINNEDFASVTVIAKTLETADMLATVVSVLSKVDAESLLQERADVKAVTINKKLKIKYYNFE